MVDPTALPVVIVGAGPAGLAAARALALRDIDYVQLERHTDVGGIWDIDNPGTPMYKSAHFISSRDKSGFYDYPMPASFADYPSRTQILDYTRAFADEFGLRQRIRFGTSVTSVTEDSGVWTVHTTDGTIQARAVIACSGVTWDARIPDVPGTFDGEIIHSVNYRDTSQFAGKRVLIVGLGNSGADIACDAAASADTAYISTRRGYHFIPKHILGEPSDNTEWLPIWGERLLYNIMKPIVIGDVRRWGLPKPDHKLFESHPLLNTQLLHYLQHGDITAKPGIERFDGPDVVFTDGSRAQIDLVVFATGYDMSIPYVPDDYVDWKSHRPDLYLNVFSRRKDDLFGVSYIEVNSSAYTLFDHIANLIAQYLVDERDRPQAAERFRKLVQHDRPDLSGGIHFVATDRHATYVEVRAFRKQLRRIARLLGWSTLAPGMFDRLRRSTGAARDAA
ncbi:MAG TPA: NAD(P)-binding domain-containing protein [Rhodoglobus sp.]|nr:NAD(P)-binding domain-containing protein [Rhodoglobus sp.]